MPPSPLKGSVAPKPPKGECKAPEISKGSVVSLKGSVGSETPKGERFR